MDKFFSQVSSQQGAKSAGGPSVAQQHQSSGEVKKKDDDSTPKQLPKGVVLGPDGKPCRSCTSVSAWFALAKQQQQASPSSSTSNSTTSSTPSSSTSPSTPPSSTLDPSFPPAHCPPSVESLGSSSWTLLHTLTASYPSTPTPTQKSDMSTFLHLFGKLYPCWTCAADFQKWMATETPKLESRSDFGDWMCRAHNAVNRKLGKEEFDCRRWEERWRTGPRDGSCG